MNPDEEAPLLQRASHQTHAQRIQEARAYYQAHLISSGNQLLHAVDTILTITFLVLLWIQLAPGRGTWPWLPLFAPLVIAFLARGIVRLGILNRLLELMNTPIMKRVMGFIALGIVPELSIVMVGVMIPMKLDGLDTGSWLLMTSPFIVDIIIAFFASPFVLKYINIPSGAVQSDWVVALKMTVILIACKADNLIEIPWSWALIFLWIPASVAAFVIFASLFPMILYVANSTFRENFQANGGIREHPWSRGTYVNLELFCKLAKILFIFLWFISLGVFITVLTFSMYLDGGLKSVTLFHITFAGVVFTFAVKLVCLGILYQTLPKVFLSAADALSMGLDRELHPSTGKCPMCREPVKAVLEINEKGKVLQQIGKKIPTNMLEIYRQSSTLIHFVRSGAMDSQPPEQSV